MSGTDLRKRTVIPAKYLTQANQYTENVAKHVVRAQTLVKSTFLEAPPELVQGSATTDSLHKITVRTLEQSFIIRANETLSYVTFFFGFLLLGSAISIAIWAGVGKPTSVLFLRIVQGLPFYSNVVTPAGFYESEDLIGNYGIYYLLPILPLISGLAMLFRLFHLQQGWSWAGTGMDIIDTMKDNFYFSNILYGVFTVRLMEWILTVPLGFWMIASIVGATELSLLVLVLALSLAFVFLLFIHEAFNYLIANYHKRIIPSLDRPSLLNPKNQPQNLPTYQDPNKKKNLAKPSFVTLPTFNSILYIFRSYIGFMGASIIHLWFWVMVMIYWGYAGVSNTSAWKGYRWAIIPTEMALCMIAGLAMLLWTRNMEYEEEYIERHSGYKTVLTSEGVVMYEKLSSPGKLRNFATVPGQTSIPMAPSPQRSKIDYQIIMWNHNLRLELGLLIISTLAILVFVWTIWLGMLYT